MTVPKIALKNVYKHFGPKKVLNGIDLEVAKGESLVVIGGSGTGKSVMLKSILGLLTPAAGSIQVDGVETKRLRSRERTPGFIVEGQLSAATVGAGGGMAAHQVVERGDAQAERAVGEAATQELERLGIAGRGVAHDPGGHALRSGRDRGPVGSEGLAHG